jgi:NADH:ubiquinone oxidoreductase subunit H
MTAYIQTLLGYEAGWFVGTLALILLIAFPLMLAVAMIIYVDRKIWAAIALRKGPNVVGPFGLLQSFADGLKVFLQETIIPSGANKGLFLLAPILTFTVALLAWAVIPFGEGMVLANINIGLLYILAVSSLGVYGVVIAGWASNSKYPFFSAMRAAAQMISYEVSIGFIIISVVLMAGSFNLQDIIHRPEIPSARDQRLWCEPAAIPDGGDVPDLLARRNRAHPVRSDRGGKRAGRRLSDRIFVHVLRALLARRICQCIADVRAERDPVLGWLAATD